MRGPHAQLAEFRNLSDRRPGARRHNITIFVRARVKLTTLLRFLRIMIPSSRAISADEGTANEPGWQDLLFRFGHEGQARTPHPDDDPLCRLRMMYQGDHAQT